MSDNYVSRLEKLLMVLNEIVQKVPEAKGLLNNLGIDPADPYLQTTAVDKNTGETRKRTETEARSRVDDLEEAIKDNQKLNDIIQQRIALLQQETNAKKQASAVTGSTSTPSATTSPSPSSSGSGRRSSTQPEVPGDFNVIVPERKDKAPSAKRGFVLPEEADVASLTTSELAQVKLAVRAIAKKMTASGSSRGRGLLDSIKPGRSTGSALNAFEEALSSVAMEADNSFVEFGVNAATRLGDIANFRKSLPTLTQIIRKATKGPVLRPNKISSVGEDAAGSRNVKYVLSSSAGSDDDSGGGDGEAFRVNTDQRATGQSRRRAIHNTFGRVRDSIRHALGIPTGKGNDQDLRIQHDRNAGNIEAAGSNDMLQEGVDESLMNTMRQVISASIDDVRAGRVSSPSTGRGGIASPAIPETLKATLVKYAPQIEALSKDTTARGAIGKEGGGIGVLGAPDAQHTLVSLFSAIVAAKISNPSVGKTKEEQEAALRGIDVKEVFGNLFSPDSVTGREQATTSIAGIMHRRVLEDLQKKAKDAEESYIAESDGEIKKEKLARLRMAQNELKAYEKLDEKPTVIPVTPAAAPEKKPTDATMAMKYRMPQSQLREDLKTKYLTGTTTAQLVEEGVRTATTRSGGGYKPGQIIEIPEVPGKRYQVTSVEKPDFSTPEGIAAWEEKEGWSFKDLPKSLRAQVTNPKARQISFKPYEESESTTALSTDVKEIVIPPAIPVPADMIANPTAKVTGVENNPEEMIQRVAGGRFDQGTKFTDFITDVRAQASKVLPYLTRIGRANLPVLFDSPTPLRRIVENAAEGIALDDELPSEKQQQDLASINSKQTDNVLAELGLISANSKYQNFYSGLNTAETITNNDGTINEKAVQNLSNPRGKIRSFFSSIQQLEQAEYNGFPILDYARANKPDDLNTELIEQMEKASPVLKNLPKGLLGQIRDISESQEFQKSDSFSQFAQLTDLVRPVLEPLLGGGKRGKDIADVLVAAPAKARASLPLLHTPGTMSDKLAEVLGNTEELDEARKPEADWRSPVQMAKGLRYRIQALAKSITGRFPSPAYNDLRVQEHKRKGIVEYDKDIEDLNITDKLAEQQYLASLRPEERATLIGDQEEENYSAGENARIEEERERVNRILKDPQSADEVKERGIILARIAAGQEPLGPEFAERDQLTDDIVYDYEGNRAYTKRPSYIDKPSEKSKIDEIVANFQKEQAGNNGLKQLLATAIGSPTARGSIIKSFETMSPGMAGSLRFTDFAEQSSVDDFIRANSKTAESREQAKQLADLMKRERGTKYLKDPAIAGLLSRAEQESPTKVMVAERQARAKEEKEQAGDIGRRVGKLRVISNLRNFGFPSKENLSSPVDSAELKKIQTMLSVLSPENTEEFRNIDASDPKQVEQLNRTRANPESVLGRARKIAFRLSEDLYRIQGGSKTTPSEDINELEKRIPEGVSSVWMGSHLQNAQLLAKEKRESVSYAVEGGIHMEAKQRMDERLNTLSPDEEKQYEAYMKDYESRAADRKIVQGQYADRQDKRREEVNAMIDASVERRGRPVSIGARLRILRSMGLPDINFFSNLKKPRRPGEALSRDERQALYEESPEKQEAEAAIAAHRASIEAMPIPTIDYSFNRASAKGLPETAAALREIPEVEAVVKAQYGQEEIPYESRYGSAFGGAGIQPNSRAYRELTGGSDARREALIAEGQPEDEVEEDRKALAALYQQEMRNRAEMAEDARERAKNTTGAKIHPDAKENEKLTDEELDRKYGESSSKWMSRTESRRIAAEEKSAAEQKRLEDERLANEAERQRMIDEDRINRRKTRSIESKRRQPETNARVAAREAGPRAARQARLQAESEKAERIVREAREEENRVTGRFLLPAPDPSKPEEEYTKTHSQLEAERVAKEQADEAERQRLIDRRRSILGRFDYVHKRYSGGRGDRSRRQFNLSGPTIEVDPVQVREATQGAFEEYLSGDMSVRRPLNYQRQDRPQSRFQLFRERMAARYRRSTNEGVDVGQMPLFPTTEREQSATIAEERELRRKQIAENERKVKERKVEEMIKVGDEYVAELDKKEENAFLEAERRRITEKKEKEKIDEDRLNRRKAKSIESKRRQPETAAKVAAREEKQYMSEPAVARRTKIAEERRDKREQEAESQVRSIREVTRRREDAEIREEEYGGRLKFIRRLNFDARLPKPGATYQPPKYERQQSVDNPEYQAAVEQAREKVNKIAGLSESQRASQLQRLIGKITIPKKIKPPETPAEPVSKFTKFKESTSSLFRRFTNELSGIKNEVTNEGMDISALPLFPDVGTGKNVLVRDTPRIARKRNEAAERLADRSETDAKIAAREAGPRAARREKLEAERAEKKRVIDEERLNRRKAKSIESKRRQPQTEAKVAARERKAYFSDPAVARRAAAGEVYDGESRPTMMVNPAIANRRAEIDRRLEERFKAKSARERLTAADINPSDLKSIRASLESQITEIESKTGPRTSEEEALLNTLKKATAPKSSRKAIAAALNEVSDRDAMQNKERIRERAQRMLSREENPEYAKAVSNVKKWMDQEKIKDPAQREKFLSMINVPRYRDMDSLVEKPNAYKVQVQRTRDKDNINLAELRDYASGRRLPPTDNPELQKSLAARVVEDAIQRKYYSDMGPLTAEETASRDAKAQRARDRLVKNIRPYNDDWRREQRRAKIEQIMTRPEEILSEAEKNAKADLIARAAKGEDVYELDPAKSGKGRKGSGGGGGGGGGGDDPPEDGDEGTGGKGKGKGRGGKGDSTSVTAESIVINAKTVIANGAPVNVIAKTVMTGVPPKGGAGASSGTGAASGTPATGAPAAPGAHAAPGAPGTIAIPAAVPSGPIMPGSSTARFVRMSPFGPVYSTAPASAAPGAPGAPGTTTAGTAATTAAGASIAIGGAGMSGLFAGLFGGGGGGGGGTGGAFGLGGEFGEGGNRTFGADRLMSVQRLKAMRNAYEQNMGSLSGSNVGVSRSELVNTAQTTMMDIIDHEGSYQSLLKSAGDAGLTTEAADVQEAYDAILDPSKTIADLATDLLKLQTALANLSKAAQAAKADITNTDDVIEAATAAEAKAGITSLLANYGAEEQDKVRGDLEREGNRRLGNLREGLQANGTQQSLFGWTTSQALTRRRLLKEYATAATGGNPDELYRRGEIVAYRKAVNVKGVEVIPERRIDIRKATQADLEYTQQKLSQNKNSTITVQDLATLQKTMFEERSQRNQTSMASRFSHITQKAQQANYWATAMFNAPTDIMNLVDQAVRPALNAEKTMITARTLALTPQAYGNALQAAQTQQSMFGGTLTKNIGAVTGFIPMANAYGVDINKTFNVARKLAAFDPAQGTEGAQIALREYLSGNMSSLSRRFELSRSALSNIKQGDASEMIDSLDNLLNGMGITDRLIDDQAASMATKYDKMLGRLESVQLHFSKLAVNAISPILEKFAGEDSWMATKTKTDTTTSVLNERVAKVGDDVISNSKNGSKTLKDLDVNSPTFFKDLDTMIASANDAMIKENKLIEDSTGVDVNAKLLKRVHSLNPFEQAKFMTQVKLKMMTGMESESAIRQTMNEQTDYAGFEQFVTSRRELGSLKLTQKDTDKRFADANTAIIGKSGTKITVKDLTVLDGDTFRFTLPNGESLDGRMLGIDAPESSTAESAVVKAFVNSILNDPNKTVSIVEGYGVDPNDRAKIRAEVTDTKTGDVVDLGALLLSQGMVEFQDFGKADQESGVVRDIYSMYRPIAESVADRGIGVVNSVAARNGYGAAITPSQEAIDQYFANKYGIGGSYAAGLAPYGTIGGVLGGVVGSALFPGVGTVVGVGAGTAAGVAVGNYLNTTAYTEDTSTDKVTAQIAEQTKIDNRKALEKSLSTDVRLSSMNAAKDAYNLQLQKKVEKGTLTQESANLSKLTDADVTEMNAIITGQVPMPDRGFSPGRIALREAGTTGADALTTELATAYETQRADIESKIMQQVSTLTPEEQKVFSMQVPSSLDPTKQVSFIQDSIDVLAKQAVGASNVEGAAALSSTQTIKDAESYASILEKFLSPENRSKMATVINAGELVKVPTGNVVTKTDPKTGKEVQEPEYEYVAPTPANIQKALVEKDSTFFDSVAATAATIQVSGKSTFFEETKKATDVLLDEQTKIRENLVSRLTENAALLSFTGLGEVSARDQAESGINAQSTVAGYNTGTSGDVIPTTPRFNQSQQAYSMLTGSQIDPSKSGNTPAVTEMETLLKEQIDKIEKSAKAFDQIASTTYAFDVQFKGTFRNFVDSMKAAGKNASTIMSNMGQGNPRFAMDYLDQITGINAKQFTMQYQLNPGFPNKQINGPSASYGYTQGPMGTMKFVSDFFNNGDFAAQFNLGESMQMINMAASANTQMVQRGMQHNWQMQDLARDNARSIADINRNGMLSLQNIHRGYVQQMLVIASQAEVDKRFSEVSTQEAINTSDLPADVRNSIDVEDKIGRARAQYLGQFDIEGYLGTDIGAKDTEMKGLFDQFNAMGNPDSPEARKFWEEVIRPAANKRKDAAYARSQDESLSTDEREAATKEYISLNENPELTVKALGIVDDTTKDRLRRASMIRQNEKNLERLQLQRKGLLATGGRLAEQAQKGTPEEQAAVGLQIEENNKSLEENASAMELASRTITTLREQDADWQEAFLERWKQLKTGIGTTTAGVVLSIEELARNMDLQLTEAYRKFELARTDMVTAFTRSAAEIAIQVPLSLMPMYDAILAYQSSSSAAEIAYNNGVNLYAGGPGQGTTPELVGGPQAAFNIKMQGAQAAADILYPNKDDPARAKLLSTIAAAARAAFPPADPNRDKTKDGLPAGFETLTMMYEGVQTLRVVVVNGKELALAAGGTEVTQQIPGDLNGNGILDPWEK